MCYIVGQIESQEDLDSFLYDVHKKISHYVKSLKDSYEEGVYDGYEKAKDEIEYDPEYDS